MSSLKKKYAFISYSHKDKKIAKWLQNKLESYKLPTGICNECENSRYLRPIFRDDSDLNSGILSDEIKAHLNDSKYLIVICSPNSAKSPWVNKEIKTFLNLGRLSRIIPVVVDGNLGSKNETECLPQALAEHFDMHSEDELLFIDIRLNGRQKTFIQIVSCLLGVEFDSLWHRYLRNKHRAQFAQSLISIFLFFTIYWFAIPVSLDIHISETPLTLPSFKEAKMIIADNEHYINGTDTIIHKMKPGYWKLRNIDMSFRATYYNNLDTTITLGLGLSNCINLKLNRDSTFGIYAGKVIDELGNPISGAFVKTTENLVDTTDINGFFRIEVPLKEQSETKSVVVQKNGFLKFERIDEPPHTNIIYILHK